MSQCLWASSPGTLYEVVTLCRVHRFAIEHKAGPFDSHRFTEYCYVTDASGGGTLTLVHKAQPIQRFSGYLQYAINALFRPGSLRDARMRGVCDGALGGLVCLYRHLA